MWSTSKNVIHIHSESPISQSANQLLISGHFSGPQLRHHLCQVTAATLPCTPSVASAVRSWPTVPTAESFGKSWICWCGKSMKITAAAEMLELLELKMSVRCFRKEVSWQIGHGDTVHSAVTMQQAYVQLNWRCHIQTLDNVI